MVGIIPNVIVISLCTTMVAVATLASLEEEKKINEVDEDAEEEIKGDKKSMIGHT